MRFSSLLNPTAAKLVFLTQFLVFSTQGVTFDPVPLPNLDLSQLGRVALTGDFDSISLYTYRQQTESLFSSNGSQALITQLPNGDFTAAATADAYIKTMCPFVLQNGQLAGVVVGGNFTSLGGIEAQGIAMYHPDTSQITPLEGLQGQISVVLCDQDTNRVYVGGDFKAPTSTNAIAWVAETGWQNLPFAGFNGPVTSIAKAPDGNIIFGGSFTGLGNATGNATSLKSRDQQVVNLSSANISSASTTTADGFNDPKNIICKDTGQDSPGNTWLLEDNSPGFWRADMNFGYQPTRLRIWNTHQDGRGTKTFRFTAFPINGIMNFTFTDPATGSKSYCDARCPLSNNASVDYQDFRFINNVGMSSFQIDISEWYGAGGGLTGIELVQDDIYAYALSDLNEPACAKVDFASNSTATGPWTVASSAQTQSQYLTADIPGPNIGSRDASVVFQPDIKQPGNYSVMIYTPGCLQDNSCDRRGIANVTGIFTAGGALIQPPAIYQTNNFDKYDQIYTGPVDANSQDFRPTVTLTPSSDQKNPITLVAQRVRFLPINSTGGLNGLYEYDPDSNTVDTDFSNSAINQAGKDLEAGAIITSLAVVEGISYVGGNFNNTDSGFTNIFSITNGNASLLPNGGLNAQVAALLSYEDLLYVGGNFTNTANGSVAGLNNVAVYDIKAQTWSALGSGVRGQVNTIVPLELNISDNQPETCITINGRFDQLEAFGTFQTVTIQGFGVWVPSQKNWLQNLNLTIRTLTGQLSASTNVTGGTLLAGTISSQGVPGAQDAVSLASDPSLQLNSLGLKIQQDQIGASGVSKRAVGGPNITGAVTGLFHKSGGLNVTVIGGHFTATATNGSIIKNLAFIDGTGAVSGLGDGLDEDSVFLALATLEDILYAGGTISGQVNNADINGLILFDLSQGDYVYPQPAALGGDDVAVNAISARPKSDQVYVAGNFQTAGSLPCPSVCMFEKSQWSQPGSGLAGTVAALAWQGNDKLLVGGNMTVNGNLSSLANYDTKKFQWTPVDDSASAIPGPVTALTPANDDASQFWVAGSSTNGSAFLCKYDGSQFRTVGDGAVFGNQTTIQGLSMFSVKDKHDDNDFVDQSMVLLVTGALNIPNFGNASAALFNGTTLTPFILSTSGSGPGSLSQVFSEKTINFKSSGGHMAIGFVVLIALACALGATFLLVLAGTLIERYRRRAQGYQLAPTTYFDKTANMGRIPPEHLFGRLGQRGRGDAPML